MLHYLGRYAHTVIEILHEIKMILNFINIKTEIKMIVRDESGI